MDIAPSRLSPSYWKPPAPARAALFVPEACEYLGGISKQTLYRIAHSGRIRLVKIAGRTVVPVTDLDALLSEGMS